MILFLAALAKWAMLDIERKLGQQTGSSAGLSKIDAALANFVAQYKRLPCPANGAIASGSPNAGIEMSFRLYQSNRGRRSLGDAWHF